MLDFFTADFASDIIQSVGCKSLTLECMEENTMKSWNTPAIEELNINETAGGGQKTMNWDGEWITPDEGKSWWAGTVIVSG